MHASSLQTLQCSLWVCECSKEDISPLVRSHQEPIQSTYTLLFCTSVYLSTQCWLWSYDQQFVAWWPAWLGLAAGSGCRKVTVLVGQSLIPHPQPNLPASPKRDDYGTAAHGHLSKYHTLAGTTCYWWPQAGLGQIESMLFCPIVAGQWFKTPAQLFGRERKQLLSLPMPPTKCHLGVVIGHLGPLTYCFS